VFRDDRRAQRELCLSVRRFVHERRTGEGTTETQRVVV
jgi:hypothetical protein